MSSEPAETKIVADESWKERVRAENAEIDRRAGPKACIDLFFQLQVHHAVRVSARPHRRHPAGEVEAREALAKLRVDRGPGRVIQVLVHHHETGDDRLARRRLRQAVRRRTG